MMKQMLILTCMIALAFPLALTGCNRGEMESLRADLARTEAERDDLKSRMDIVTQTRDQLQEQVNELTTSRDQLQAQVTELAGSRDRLQKLVEGLTTSRDALQEQVGSKSAPSRGHATRLLPRHRKPRKESTSLRLSCRARQQRFASCRVS
jgi:septal ring factor EnvC (AmiA/AmiB activator)